MEMTSSALGNFESQRILTEEEFRGLEERLEKIRKTKKATQERFSSMPEIQNKLIMNLEAQEHFIIEFIHDMRKKAYVRALVS